MELKHNTIACKFAPVSRRPAAILLTLWVLGLGIGYLCSLHIEYKLQLDSALSIPLTLLGSFVIRVFPLILSGVALLFRARFVLFPLSFLKSYCLAFSLGCVSGHFGSAGWLICVMLLFSDFFASASLLWLWIRFFKRFHFGIWIDYITVFLFNILVAFFDSYVVSLFVSALF